MQEKNFNIFTSENIDFDLNFDEIAYKISQILPFSSVLIICKEQDYFDFGNYFCSLLSGVGLKPTTLVYNQNIINQIDDLSKEYSFEKRGAIFFCKDAFITFLNSNHYLEKAFYIQTNCNTYQIFNKSHLNKSVHFFFSSRYFDKSLLKKSLAVKTMHLIDYAFRNTLFDYRVDTMFFSYIKKKLVNALFSLESEQQNKSELFYIDLELDYLFYKSDYNFCSANVCSFLLNKDFFDLDTCFHFSNLLIKNCKEFLAGKLQKQNLNYSERASILTLYVKRDKYQTLTDLNKQLSLLKNTDLNGIKQQLKKLILIYQKFSQIVQKEQNQKLPNEQSQEIIATLSGDTKFSINCMTAFRESITL